jgi:hypothetical protein
VSALVFSTIVSGEERHIIILFSKKHAVEISVLSTAIGKAIKI